MADTTTITVAKIDRALWRQFRSNTMLIGVPVYAALNSALAAFNKENRAEGRPRKEVAGT